jgi:hypothetical protein
MDRKSYKSKPQHIISDPRTGQIKRIVQPSDTDIGSSNVGANFRVYGDLSISGDTKTIDGSTLIAGGPNITITTASNGQITISAVAASGASASLSYITVASEGTLSSERVLTGGTGIKITDGGANSTITLNVHDGTVATVSGTNFTGIVKATGGISGSLQHTVSGLSYLVGGTNVTVSSASNGQVTISAAAASGAPSTAQYITLATDATLSAERVLVPSTGLFATDAGANGNYTIGVNDRYFAALTGSNFTGATTFSGGLSGSLTKLQDGTSYIIAGSNVTVVTGSGGQITISSTGGSSGGGGDPGPSYLTLALTASLPNERVFTPGTGIKATDAGAGAAYTLNINDGTVATISGSTFTGPITAVNNGGITGSITQLVGGTPFITVPAGNVITVSTGTNGQIILSGTTPASGAPLGAQYLTLVSDSQLTVERVFTPGTGLKATDAGAGGAYTLNTNDSVVATISGSTFTGPITAVLNGGITGSITVTSAGTPFITTPAGNAITVSTGSAGQIVLSASISGGSGAPTTSQYVTIGSDASLSAERALTAGTGLLLTDGGANSTVTLAVNNSVVATISGSTFTGPITAVNNGGITGSITRTTASTPFITAPAGNVITISTGSNGQIILSGSGGSNIGAPLGSAYVTIGTDAQLSSERSLTAGTGLSLTDAGAGSTVTLAINNGVVATVSGTTFTGPVIAAAAGGITGSITVTTALTPFITAPSGNAITVSTGSNGQIILSASISGGSGASTTSQYVTIGNDASLSAERALTAGAGLRLTDAGANSTVTLAIDNGTVATISGSTFTGPIIAVSNGGITGSITSLVGGNPFITVPAGNVITVSTGSGGQIILSGTTPAAGAPLGAQYITLAVDGQLSSERVLTAGTGLSLADAGAGSTATLAINNNVVATISGSTFTGPITAVNNGGITGSITVTSAGTPFITVPAGNGISVTTGSNGQIILSGSSGGAGSGAPTSAQYITLATDATLSAERVFTPGTGLIATDGGAGSTYTLNVNNSVVATISGSTFTGPIVAVNNGGITGSITRLVGGTPFITVPSGNVISVSTGSNGQIILSGSGGSNIGAPLGSAYVTIGADAQLPSDRALTAGTGLTLVDAGAGSTVTLAINNGTVATISGSTFTGAIVAAAAGGITGSITQTTAATPFITAPSGNAITVSTGSNGQIILSASISGGSGAPTTSPYVTIGSDASLSAERALTAGTGILLTDGGANSTVTLGINNNVVATISGSTFTGAITAVLNGGITGSITRLVGGTPFITVPSGNVISVSTGSNGQIILSGSGGSNIGAPLGSAYVTIGTDAQLSSERSLTAGTGLSLTDGGAGSTATLAIKNNVVATISGSTFTGAITAVANGGITGSITKLVGGTPFITSPSGNAVTVTTGSGGQIILSASISGGASTSAAGSTGQFQINNASAFSASAQFTYDSTNNRAVAGINGFEISNPAGTFGTVLKSAAVVADRTLNLPLLTTTDTVAVLDFAQTFTNKTLTSPVINTPNFGANNITTTGTGTFSAGVVAGRVTLTSQNITTTPTIDNAPLGTGVSTLSFSGAGPLICTGIAGGVDGRMLFILNNSGDTLTLNHEDASSVAANRFTNCYSVNHIIQPGVSVVIIYFSTTNRWHPCISF